MILTFTEGDGFADADDVADQTATQRYRVSIGALLGWGIAPLQTAAERAVDYLFEALLLGAAQSLQCGSDIIINRQRCPHAS